MKKFDSPLKAAFTWANPKARYTVLIDLHQRPSAQHLLQLREVGIPLYPTSTIQTGFNLTREQIRSLADLEVVKYLELTEERFPAA
jgi:hypothetical protein